jgi:hypothetical protein
LEEYYEIEKNNHLQVMVRAINNTRESDFEIKRFWDCNYAQSKNNKQKQTFPSRWDYYSIICVQANGNSDDPEGSLSLHKVKQTNITYQTIKQLTNIKHTVKFKI